MWNVRLRRTHLEPVAHDVVQCPAQFPLIGNLPGNIENINGAVPPEDHYFRWKRSRSSDPSGRSRGRPLFARNEPLVLSNRYP